MTSQEFEALVQLTLRAAMSQAEQMWFLSLVQKTRAQLGKQQVQEAANAEQAETR